MNIKNKTFIVIQMDDLQCLPRDLLYKQTPKANN